MLGCNLYLKFEHLQCTGSFKARGALTKMHLLPPESRGRGIVTASGGNHGLGVCHAARIFNENAHVFLHSNVPKYKSDLIRELGGQVHLHGDAFDESNEAAMQFAREHNMTYVHPFDDPDVILGQSTVAVEILEQLPEVDIVVTSIGGGGLISGIGTFLKEATAQQPAEEGGRGTRRHIKVYGVETEGAASMFSSLQCNQIVTLPAIRSIAESLGAKRVSDLTFKTVKRVTDDCVVVTDEEAMSALLLLLQRENQLVEPAASCSLAALLPPISPPTSDLLQLSQPKRALLQQEIKGKNVVVLLCGGNFPLSKLPSYIKQQ